MNLQSGNANTLLKVDGLSAGYGASQVLFDLHLTINKGEVVTLLGRNGMGKSTSVKCITGMLNPTSGSVSFRGHEISKMAAYRISRLGIGLVPEGRRIFSTLTVYENLVATARANEDRVTGWSLERVFQLFPRLEQRHKQIAGQMSGGEQQMLAIGRALMINPTLLILDEATEGLAPLIRLEIWNCLSQLKDIGQSMLVIDKNLQPLLALADRHYVMEKGRVVWVGSSTDLIEQEQEIQTHLGV